ncbi:MAG: hypothetical protein ACLR0U_30340 [Enterocloster clostridioformis]
MRAAGRARRDKAKSIPLLELEHITDSGFIQDLNLTVYQGEVQGIAGKIQELLESALI